MALFQKKKKKAGRPRKAESETVVITPDEPKLGEHGKALKELATTEPAPPPARPIGAPPPEECVSEGVTRLGYVFKLKSHRKIFIPFKKEGADV